MLFLQYMVLRFWWYCTEMRNSRIVTTQLPTTRKALLQHFTAFTYSYTHTFTHWRAAMQKANPLIRSDNNKSSPAIFQCSADHTSTPTLMEKPSGAIRGPSRAAVARRETIYGGDDVNHQRPQRLNKKDSIYFVTGPLSGQPGVYLYHLKLLVFTQPSFSSLCGHCLCDLWPQTCCSAIFPGLMTRALLLRKIQLSSLKLCPWLHRADWATPPWLVSPRHTAKMSLNYIYGRSSRRINAAYHRSTR